MSSTGPIASSEAERQERFDSLLSGFRYRFDAFRELVDLLVPHLREADKVRRDPRAIAANAGLDAQAEEQLAHWLAKRFQLPIEGAGQQAPDAPASDAASDVTRDESEELLRIFDGDVRAISTHAQYVNRLWGAPPRALMLFDSVLTMAVAAVEEAIAALVRQYYRCFPDALGASEKEFSLSDLRAFSSVEEAVDSLIEQRVDRLMRRSFEDWSEWFKTASGFGLEAVARDLDRLTEVFQRRHLVVHTGGVVTKQYVQNVRLDPMPAVGTPLVTTQRYLDSALDEMASFGAALVAAAWAKWNPASVDRAAERLNAVAYDDELAGRWDSVSHLCSVGLRLRSGEERHAYARINYWLAEKRISNGLRDDLRKEIASWDTSAMKERFRLGQAALLDDFDRLFPMLEALLGTGELERRDALQWPILEEARADARFAKLFGGE